MTVPRHALGPLAQRTDAMNLPLAATLGLALASATTDYPDPDVLIGGPYEVRVLPDLAYHDGPEADPRKHKLDLYLPEGVRDFPAVMFVHGGAWTSGDRKMYAGLGHLFARNGIAAAVISYRLSPKVQHPAHVEDVARAFAWLHEHIAEHGGRPDRLFVTGQSAGGHLAALLAADAKYLAAHGLSPRDIRGVMPMSGVYLFPESGRMFRRVLGDDPEAPRSASPLGFVGGDEPPFLILYAERDFQGCDLMSRALADALKAAGIDADCLMIPGRNHISIIFRMMQGEADPAAQQLLRFVARHAGLTLVPRVARAAVPAGVPGEDADGRSADDR